MNRYCTSWPKVPKVIYPNPVKLREAFREAFTLTLGLWWPTIRTNGKLFLLQVRPKVATIRPFILLFSQFG